MNVNIPEINPSPRSMPNGVILVLGISYPGLVEDRDKTRGRALPKIFTYAALKAGNLWYLTGGGKVPHAATWLAVERWLERDNRVLEFVEILGPSRRIWPESIGAAALDDQTGWNVG